MIYLSLKKRCSDEAMKIRIGVDVIFYFFI